MSQSLRERIQEQGSTMILGDSTNLRQLLESEYDAEEVEGAVDVTITSPPYADRKIYEAAREDQIGIDEPYNEYLSNLKRVFEDVYQVTNDTGTLWVVVNTFKEDHRMVDLPGDIIDICNGANTPSYCPKCETQGLTVPVESSADGSRKYCPNCNAPLGGDGWLLQDIVVWDKKRALPYSSKGSFRNVFEYVLCFSKTKTFEFNLDKIRNPNLEDLKEWWVNYPERYHPRGKLPDNIWSMVTPSQGAFADTSVDHPAPFPPRLVERILDLTTKTDDVVLDPFAGSGMVCAQAKAMGRHAIGVELSEAYLERYSKLETEIAEKWATRLENNKVLQKKQKEFTRAISGLRQIRFCRELIRSLGKNYDLPVGKLGVEGILHDSTAIGDPTANPQAFIEMEVELLCDEHNLPEPLAAFSETVHTVMNEKPCNSFGIDSNVNLTPVEGDRVTLKASQLFNDRKEKQRGYLYTGGAHNQYKDQAPLIELVATIEEHRDSRNVFPPIISTVGVDIPQPGNVCLECGEYTYSVEYSSEDIPEMKVPLSQ
ncbi:DNA-methyltransferase [Haloprofundus salinisoli]|uniref:DNA-methyltransferase n=1 Tax=Haloprofundus salinisoli TaxID=2876193 RepID=UPI001CCBFC77|nr:site-specific DNA-methyltransferase [Haloprofundus salinisoli]